MIKCSFIAYESKVSTPFEHCSLESLWPLTARALAQVMVQLLTGGAADRPAAPD